MLPFYLVTALLLPASSFAHLALWDPGQLAFLSLPPRRLELTTPLLLRFFPPSLRFVSGMYGFDGNVAGVINYNNNRPVVRFLPFLPPNLTNRRVQAETHLPFLLPLLLSFSCSSQQPLKEINKLSVSQWFGNGQMAYPPTSGNFMEVRREGTERA